jgi:phosphoglycolate phosphatase
MNKYKLIIFDFDGTLFATHDAILFAIQAAYEQLGKSLPEYSLADQTIRAGLGMENSLRLLNPESSDEEIKQLNQTYETIYAQVGAEKSHPFPGVYSLLKTLKSAGLVLTIVSNKAVAAIHAALKHFRLNTFISIVVGDTPTLRKKPDPMAYNEFIQPQFPLIKTQEILMVGDTPADLGFAHAIGADSCWVKYGYGDPTRCRALNPTYTIEELIDLQPLLLG